MIADPKVPITSRPTVVPLSYGSLPVGIGVLVGNSAAAAVGTDTAVPVNEAKETMEKWLPSENKGTR